MSQILDFAVAALLGLLVGLAELVSRYRDSPQQVLYARPALLYLSINGAASAFALALTHFYGWSFGATAGSARWTQVLVAGVGAMALFRTSLFAVRAGDKDIGVGPSTFLQIFLDAADREVDRLRALARSKSVAKLMEGVDYQKASDVLVPYCLALMQNVPKGEQQKLEEAVKLLAAQMLDSGIKVRILGLHLIGVIGAEVLEAAVETLRPDLKSAPPQPPQPAASK